MLKSPFLVCALAALGVAAALLAPSGAAAGEAALWPPTLGPLPPLVPPAPLPSLSAQTCNACHGAIHDGWIDSGHGSAARNPVWLAAIRAQGDPPICRECHQPLIEQRPTLPDGPPSLQTRKGAANPAWQPTLSDEGVTCVACHLRDGVILGPRDLPPGAAPHPVARSVGLLEPAFCGSCHQATLPGGEARPWLDTLGEWSRSAYGQAGIGCRDCHMVRESGPIAGSRFAAYATHGTEGHDPAMLRRAVTMDLRVQAPSVQRSTGLRVTATLHNTGAGHAVPTGDPSHRVEVRFTVLDSQGKVAAGGEAKSAWLFRTVESVAPFREKSDDRLAAGASRPFDYTWTPGKKAGPGDYTLVVELAWWAVSSEQAQASGLKTEQVRIPFVEQRVPIRAD